MGNSKVIRITRMQKDKILQHCVVTENNSEVITLSSMPYTATNNEDILLKTAPQEELDELFKIFVESLTVRAMHALSHNKTCTFEDLIKLTKKKLMAIKHCGFGTVAEILNKREKLCQIMLSAYADGESPCSDDVYLKMFGKPKNILNGSISHLLFKSTYDYQNEWTLDTIFQKLSARASNVLRFGRINTLEGFLTLDEKQLYSLKNAGVKTVLEIQDLQRKIRELLIKAQEEGETSLSASSLQAIEDFGSFYMSDSKYSEFNFETPLESISSLLQRFGISEVDIKAYFLRKGMLGQPPITLQKTGDVLGVTRERIRQIKSRVEKLSLKHQYAFRPIVQKAFDVVTQNGGILNIPEFLQLLFANASGENPLKYAEPFVEFLSELPCWSETGLQPISDGIITCKNTTEILERIIAEIIQVAGNNADEKIDSDLWSIDADSLKMSLMQLFGQTSDQLETERISDTLLDVAMQKLDKPMRRRDNRIYSHNLYNFRFGSLMVLVETVLQRSAKPMHSTEVLRAIVKLRKTDSNLNKRRVTGSLNRSKKVMLWDRGTYVHRENIKKPNDLLRNIEVSIEKELSQNIPFLSVSKIFDMYKAQCLSKNLTSETALYMCLRELNNPRLAYSRYPYVLLKGNERLPVSIVLEQYVNDLGKSVSFRELKEYATNELGMSGKLFNISVYQVPNLLLLRKGVFLHIDRFPINNESLNSLISQVIDVLMREKQISAEELFSDMKNACSALGITTPYLLHSLLILKAADKISGRYPKLILIDDAKSI